MSAAVAGVRYASVVLDVDSTLSHVEGIEWLAERRGPSVAQAVADMTQRAMDGTTPLDSVYGARLALVQPTRADVDAIPVDQRDGWLLQRKVEYARELVTPSGDGVAVEVRVMCLRADGETELRPSWNLVRLSRGKMHGVDHNRDLEFTGSTVALRARA